MEKTFFNSAIQDICYHGTDSEPFNELDSVKIQKSPEEGDAGYFGWGFYLTNDKDYANTFGDTVLEFKVNIENPFTFEDVDYASMVDFLYNDSGDSLSAHINDTMYFFNLISGDSDLEFPNDNSKELKNKCAEVFEKFDLDNNITDELQEEVMGLLIELAPNINNWLNGMFFYFGEELYHYFTENGYDGVIALGGKEIVVYDSKQLQLVEEEVKEDLELDDEEDYEFKFPEELRPFSIPSNFHYFDEYKNDNVWCVFTWCSLVLLDAEYNYSLEYALDKFNDLIHQDYSDTYRYITLVCSIGENPFIDDKLVLEFNSYFDKDKIREDLEIDEENKQIVEDIEKEIQVRDNPNIEEDAEECPLPLEIIPNNMGINLSNVEKVTWEEQEDGQLKKVEIEFNPARDIREDRQASRNDVLKDIIRTFGLAEDNKLPDALYILPNGKILDTKGPYDRYQHENIAKYINDKYGVNDLNKDGGSKFMDKIGAIRVTPWLLAVVIPEQRITDLQEETLYNILVILCRKSKDDKPLMISSYDGNQFLVLKDANPEEVMNSILGYQIFGILKEKLEVKGKEFAFLNSLN